MVTFYSAVIPKFVGLMLSGKRSIILGDDLSSRDFIYVYNIVNADLLACKCKMTGKAVVINIGSGRVIILNALVVSLNRILGTDFEPIYEN